MKKTTNKNRTYEAPQLIAVTFKVEQGFATSGMRSLFTHHDDVLNEDVNTTFGRTGYGTAEGESYFTTWD